MDLSDARDLAERLIEEHLPGTHWRFDWDNARTRWGQCNYLRKTITLSRFLVPRMNEDDVLDTILHEIAHALTPGAGHGRAWKLKCRELGCDPRPRHNKHDSDEPLPFKWLLVFGEELIRGYYRYPQAVAKTLSRRYVRGREVETFGRLSLVPAEQFKGDPEQLKPRKRTNG